MAWSKDESKLIYLAEKKLPKAKPFFITPGSQNDDGKKDDSIAKV